MARSLNWPLAAGIIAGVAADAVFGDPRRGHPVAVFGSVVQAAEDRMYGDSVARGTAFAACCVLAAAAPGIAAQRLTSRRPWLLFAATAAATWTVTSAASLTAVAWQAQDALLAGDLAAARTLLPSLCGRDPRGLDAQELARAVIESVAENTSDGIVAPLLWGVVAGLPGLLAYRGVNTLDSMVGHRSARYTRFGWACARLDDVANWAPARLTGLLTAATATVAGGRPGCTLATMRRYGPRHPSPNAGRCEAAFAGALGIRLGGTNVYGERRDERPQLGGGRAPQASDICRAVRLCRTVTVTAAIGCAAAALLAGRERRTSR